MTTFDDHDLQALKEHLVTKVEHGWTMYKLEGLIERLEAAEILAECLANHKDLDPVEVTEIKNWRKAAGK